MRFEVNVDDGANLAQLHKARDAFNVANPGATADDMPSYVQRLMDGAVATALAPIQQSEQTALAAAQARIAELEAQNTTLSQEVAAAAPVQTVQAVSQPQG